MMPGIIPSLLMANQNPLTVEVLPRPQMWSSHAPFEATVTAFASGGVPPYTYNWADTGPWPVDGNYIGQNKSWRSDTGLEATVIVIVTDASGATASAGGEIVPLL